MVKWDIERLRGFLESLDASKTFPAEGSAADGGDWAAIRSQFCERVSAGCELVAAGQGRAGLGRAGQGVAW